MALAAQKNRELFAIKKSYSIEVGRTKLFSIFPQIQISNHQIPGISAISVIIV